MLQRLKTYRSAAKKAERLASELEETQAELAKTRARLAQWRERAQRSEGESLDASKLVWIFGAGRSGTTWLSAIFGELSGFEVWFEPRIGKVLDMAETNTGKHFVFSPRREPDWRRPLRSLILEGAAARYPEAEWVAVKEPGTSSTGAIMRAFPTSRLLLLVRDPRDVVASWLDAAGGWRAGRAGTGLAQRDPSAFARNRAAGYMWSVKPAREAYDSHAGPRVLVRYEDLLSDTLGEMRRLYRELGIEVDEERLCQAVEKHSWENIPKEKRGAGKFYRKASPGGWREDLTPEQVAVVEEICAPILKELYPS